MSKSYRTFSETISTTGRTSSSSHPKTFSEGIVRPNHRTKQRLSTYIELTEGLRTKIEQAALSWILEGRPFEKLTLPKRNMTSLEKRAFQEARYKGLIEAMAALAPEAKSYFDLQAKRRDLDNEWLFKNPKENFIGQKPSEHRLWGEPRQGGSS